MSSEPSKSFNCDPHLKTLVGMIEMQHAEGRKIIPFKIPLILNVGGITITGNLISEKEFFEGSHQIFQLTEEAKSASDEWLAFESNATLPEARKLYPEFIHLSNAEFPNPETFDSGQTIKVPLFWRGRLDRIDGWAVLDEKRLDALRIGTQGDL